MNTEKPTISRLAAVLAAAVLVAVPFHAFLSVWAASFVGNYTLVRLWKEYILVALVALTLVLVLRSPKLRVLMRTDALVLLIAGYALMLTVSGIIALLFEKVTVVALLYGLLLDLRFLAFFLVVFVVSSYHAAIVEKWRTLLLIPAIVVIGFALLQFFVLPANFLEHFGYGAQTIDATQTIDNKASYIRVQSTLRGANPLGAYLVIIIAALGGLLTVSKKYRIQYTVLFGLACVALAVTFSRSAWIGVVASLLWLLWGAVVSGKTRRLLLVASVGGLLAFAAVGFALRDNDTFQNAFLHTDENSRSAVSSNEARASAITTGLYEIFREPLGRGVGTAGPASFYNDEPARISENYFIQIGQEAGVLGLGLFLAINILLAKRLYRKKDELLPRILLASLIGLTVINLLSHAWTDDTLAYIWWGLAGAALAVSSDKVADHIPDQSIIKHKHE